MCVDTDGPRSLNDKWQPLFEELAGTSWETDDLTTAVENTFTLTGYPMADAMKYVYDMAKGWPRAGQEDAVNATLWACSVLYGGRFTASEVRRMGASFVVFYRDFDEPLQSHLDEHYGNIPLEWLGEHGQDQAAKEIRQDSEIWVEEEHIPGVWVFRRPGR